jgi:uncharacterized protein YyaL (SSP411 family)
MKIVYVMVFLIFLLSPTYLLANELKKETSPYLLQHADNPINWMPWSEKAFLKAKKENKPIFLSIGYSTCHWCHVMEKESFTNREIAKILNRYFISIKVDREELPQIDALYQKIYQHATGRIGGWPLTVFMTPQKKPFYITTYIPPKRRSYAEGMDTLLVKMHKLYANKMELKKSIDTIKAGKKATKVFNSEETSLASLTQDIEKAYDDIYEGFGRGKKFPEVSRVHLMLDLALLTKRSSLRESAFCMLDSMALRGLYDHVDGGFFRYSVDAAWEIPHFEKMLYNQAELIGLYSRAYLINPKPLYKKIVLETILMSQRRFEVNGLFWSASDADSDGEEGGYYTFSLQEIEQSLKNNPYKKEIQDALDMFENGNFDGKEHLNFCTATRPKGFEDFRKALQKIRAKREYPFIDKKINTAWNAMMTEALFKASTLDKSFVKKAQKSLDRLTETMFIERELYHQTLLGKTPTQKAILEDYAFFIGALISAYEVDYNPYHLHFAEYLLMQAKEKFYKKGIWYLSSDGLNVKAGTNDKYYESPQSKILEDIIKLAALKASFSYEKLFSQSMTKLSTVLEEKKSATPALARLYLMQKYGIVVIKSSQKSLQQSQLTIAKSSYPYIVTKALESENDYLACSLRHCFAKDSQLQTVLKRVEEYETDKIGE